MGRRGLRPPRGHREAGDGSGHSCGTRCPVTPPGRGPRTHVRQDTCEGGHAPGLAGTRENNPFPAAELEETGDSRGSCLRFPDDSSRISCSALGLALLTGAAGSLICLGCTRSLGRACCTSLFPLYGARMDCSAVRQHCRTGKSHSGALTEKLTQLMPFSSIIAVVERGTV